jgi:hypothetical protein
MNAEHIADALKLAPSIAFTATSVSGVVHWDTISYILAAVYTALMIVNFFWTKLVKPYVLRQTGSSDSDDS